MQSIMIWYKVNEGSSTGYEDTYDLFLEPKEYYEFKRIVLKKIESNEPVVIEDIPILAIQRAKEDIEEMVNDVLDCDDEMFNNIHIEYEIEERWEINSWDGEIKPYRD